MACRNTAFARLTAGGALLLLLAGCGASPDAAPTPTASEVTAEETTPTPSAAPELLPEGTAAENLPYFDAVMQTVLAVDSNPGGRAYVDALAAGGFDKSQMEVTFDTTHIDLAVDAVHVSVRVNGECLVGQNGPSTDGYHSAVVPLLATGTCLVGATRQIDW